MGEHYGIDISDPNTKDRLKWYFNLTIYGGGYDCWVKGLTEPSEKDLALGYELLKLKTKLIMPFMTEFKDECDSIKNIIWESNAELKAILGKGDDWKGKQLHEQQNRLISYYTNI